MTAGVGLPRSCLAVEIGIASVRAVALQRRGKTARVFWMKEEAIPRKEPGPPAPEAVKEAVCRLFRSRRLKEETVVSSLPLHRAFIRSLTLPFREIGQIRQVIASEAELHVPFPLDRIVIDFWPVEELEGGKTRVIMVAMKKEQLAAHLSLLNECGLDPAAVGVDFLGLTAAYRLTGLIDPGVPTLLLETGASHTTVGLFSRSRLRYLRSFAWGGDAVTQAIMKETGKSFAEAERMKQSFSGEVSAGEKISAAIRAALVPLGSEILRTIHSASGEEGEAAPGALLIAGGAASAPGFADFVSEKAAVAISLADPWKKVDRQPTAGESSTGLLPSLGLALSMVRSCPEKLDFRRMEFSFQGSWESIKKRLWITAVLGAGLAALLVVFLFSRIALERKWEDDLAARIRAALVRTFPAAASAAPGAELGEMESRVKKIESNDAVYRKFAVVSALDVLREISRVIPPEIDVQVVELDINQEHVRFVGRTDSFASASKIKNAFGASPFFQADKIRPGESKKKMKEGRLVTVEFSYVIPLRKDIPAGENAR
ncbi:MAG: pilus assembly protein PilM [Candidatus Aureabacteria bacterium]|nr:pilus assembly protein PilM [Candidatus Auribacterota bacterium]